MCVLNWPFHKVSMGDYITGQKEMHQEREGMGELTESSGSQWQLIMAS